MWRCLKQIGETPLARSSHSIADVGESLVVFGGEHAPREPVTNDTYVYGRLNGAWTKIDADIKAPFQRLAHAAVGVSSNTMLLHGGRSHVSESSALDDLYSFDLMTGTWSALKSKGDACPSPRNFHSAVATGGNSFYIFGGCGNEGRLADLWRYDVRSGAWEELAHSGMLGRGGAGFAATSETELYVIGGFTGKEIGQVYRFDVKQNTWEELQIEQPNNTKFRFTPRSVFARASHGSLSVAGSCAQSCSHNGHIIVFGGEVDPSDMGHAGAGLFDNTCFCLDTKLKSWHVIEDIQHQPCPRGWAASCQCEEGLIIHGGIDVHNARLDDLYMLDMHA